MQEKEKTLSKIIKLKNTNNVDNFLNSVINKIITPIIQKINLTYSTAKLKHDGQKRHTGEDYFIHLEEVANIVLFELPEPSFDEVILALLHDIIEDTDITKEILGKHFGEKMAENVQLVSKNDWQDYLSNSEKENLSKLSEKESSNYLKNIKRELKNRRNHDFFSHIKNLPFICLKIKIADRVHNLRTMNSFSSEKIKAKIQETEQYFLPTAKQKYQPGYKLLIKEINNLNSRL